MFEQSSFNALAFYSLSLYKMILLISMFDIDNKPIKTNLHKELSILL